MSVTSDLSDGFFDTLKDICTRLGCQPIDLLSVMMSESIGVKATAHNPNGDASGLIQFMPDTLTRLGWTAGPAAFRQLSAEAQLPFVEKYFTPYVPKGLSSATRLYQATFLPATLDLGSDPDTVICQQGSINSFAYEPNKVFDTNGDGAITVGELQAAIDRNAQGPRWDEIVARLNASQPPPPSSGPRIDSFSPVSGASGDQVVILGSGFTDTTDVAFGDINVSQLVVDSDAQLTVTVPEGSDAVPIIVITPSGTSNVSPELFTYTS